MSTGFEFNEELSDAFNKAFHSASTLNTAEIFDDLTFEDNFKQWEGFNGEAMVALRWGHSLGIAPPRPSKFIVKDLFLLIGEKVFYKANYINEELPIRTLLYRVSENQVIYYGQDVLTGDCAYGLMDFDTQKMSTGAGSNNVKTVLGSYHGTQLIKYLKSVN